MFGALNAYAFDAKNQRTAPQKIVSASITSDEILWSLLTSPMDRRRVLAMSPLVDNPRYSHIVHETKNVKKRFPASAEGIVSLGSDLVILSSFNNPSYKSILAKINTPYTELQGFARLDDVAKHILQIGRAIGEELRAEKLAKRFDDDLKKTKALAKHRPRVLMYSPTGNAMAGDTIFDDIIGHCGGVNLASQGGQKGWPQINAEAVLKMQPDFIILSDADQKNFAQDKIWQSLLATRCRRIVIVPAATLWSSSQFVVKAAGQICKSIAKQVQLKC